MERESEWGLCAGASAPTEFKDDDDDDANDDDNTASKSHPSGQSTAPPPPQPFSKQVSQADTHNYNANLLIRLISGALNCRLKITSPPLVTRG